MKELLRHLARPAAISSLSAPLLEATLSLLFCTKYFANSKQCCSEKLFICIILDMNTCFGTGSSEVKKCEKERGKQSGTAKSANQGHEPRKSSFGLDGVFKIVLPSEKWAVASHWGPVISCVVKMRRPSHVVPIGQKWYSEVSGLSDWPLPLQLRGSSSPHRVRKAAAPPKQVYPQTSLRGGQQAQSLAALYWEQAWPGYSLMEPAPTSNSWEPVSAVSIIRMLLNSGSFASLVD